MLDKYLIPKATTAQSKIFYLKMKGDYYRYLAENATGIERESNVLNSTWKQIFVSILFAEMAEESQNAYKNGFDIAKDQMQASDPIRLGLALNFSVFHYDILNELNIACRLAKQVLFDLMQFFFLYSSKYLFYRPSTMLWAS